MAHFNIVFIYADTRFWLKNNQTEGLLQCFPL